jgi:hypothetical protein
MGNFLYNYLSLTLANSTKLTRANTRCTFYMKSLNSMTDTVYGLVLSSLN